MRAWMDLFYAYEESVKRKYGVRKHTWKSVVCNILIYTIYTPIRYVSGTLMFLILVLYKKRGTDVFDEIIEAYEITTQEYENAWQD